LEGAGEGVWDWNVLTGEYAYSNQWRKIFGYAESDVLPGHLSLGDKIHPHDIEKNRNSMEQFLSGHVPSYNQIFRMRCKDDAYIWINSRGTSVTTDSAGKPLRVIGTHRNVDVQVKAQQRLEHSEARLRAIAENSSTVMFLKDLEGGYLYINKAFENLFNVSPDAVYGKTDFEIFPAVLAQIYRTNDQRVISTGHVLELEEDAPHENGIHTFLSLKVPVRDMDGNIYAVCGMATDITKRKRMENELRIAAVAFDSPMGMMITDEKQVIQRVNKAFEEVTGYSSEYAVGRTPGFLRTGKHDEDFYANMWRSIRETGSWQGEIWGRRRNKELYLKWLTISTVHDEAGHVTHYVSSDSDITDRKRAEAAMHQLNQKLERQKVELRELMAKNEAVRESERKHIAREVHDELGQVLTALRMDTSFIAMRFGNMDPALSTKVLGMRALVDSAIKGVRNVASNLRPMALDMGIYLALEWLCQDFTTRTGVVCTLESKEVDLCLDESRSIVVFRIVQESLTNISRYAEASKVIVTLGSSESELGVEVQDDGKGFDTVEANSRRTFGLLGMNERALGLGGSLNVVSSPGQGTTIGLTIPMERRMDGDNR
jgi:PAS domain S-box-containing protein